MTDAQKPRTLRDHARFLRRHVWLIAAMVVIAAGVAVALGLAQSKRYTASAKLYFPDPLAQAGIAGEQASNTPPAELAAQGVARLTSVSTLQGVQRALHTSLSTSEIQSNISSTTDPNTFVVTVTATAPSATLAADLANQVVRQAARQSDAAASQQFGQVARNFLTQIRTLSPAQRSNQAIVSALYDNYSRAAALSRGGAVAAQIQSTANVPTSPSTPKPLTDGVLGGVLGLILGIIIAAVREAFDRRLRGARAIESDLKLPIVGHVREDALGKSLGSANGNARVDDLDLEAFRILRTNVEFLSGDTPMRTIAVTSALPEEGKTTVASSLAFTLALAGRLTLLVECDLRRPTLSQRLGIPQWPGLTDFLAGVARPQDVVRAVSAGLPQNGAPYHDGPVANGTGIVRGGESRASGALACITAGQRTERPTELFALPAFGRFLADVTDAYDVVVLDTAPLLPVADTLQLLPSVDAVLVCLRASRTTREQAIAARTALGRLPERPTGVVLTGARDRDDYSGYYSYTYHYSSPEDSSGAPRGPVRAQAQP